MMTDFRGNGGSEMTPKNRALEGKNWTLYQEGWGSKIVKNRRTSVMDDLLQNSFKHDLLSFGALSIVAAVLFYHFVRFFELKGCRK